MTARIYPPVSAPGRVAAALLVAVAIFQVTLAGGAPFVAGTSLCGVTVRRRLLYGAAGFMVIGTIMNVASPSFVERMIWTPITIALVVALWRAARHSSLGIVPRSQVSRATSQA